jgi:RNA polymerase sigma factor (sigma-70 family)
MSFEDMLNDYNGLIWYTINHFVKSNGIPFDHTDDIYQEACARLVEVLPKYDNKKSSMKSFVVSNTNVACMRYRRTHFQHATNELKVDQDLAKVDIEKGVFGVIQNYPSSELNRSVITQKYWGYTQQEIAKECNISQSKVSRILSEFRDYLLETLKSD